MSAWIVGLILGTVYLIVYNNATPEGELSVAERQYRSQVRPADENSSTSAEVRQAWADTKFTRFGDMREELSTNMKEELDRGVQKQRADVQAFEAPVVPEIQGVMMTFDRLGV